MEWWLLIIIGLVGGLLHWALPYSADEDRSPKGLAKRAFAGIVAVFVVYYGGDAILKLIGYDIISAFGNIGLIFVGYFGLDILKIIRDYIHH